MVLAKLEAIYRFSHYMLRCHIECQGQMFAIGRFFGAMVARKVVVVELTLPQQWAPESVSHQTSHHNDLRNTRDSMRIWDCRQLTTFWRYRQCRDTVQPLASEDRNADVTLPEATQQEFEDVFEHYHGFLRDVVCQLPRIDRNHGGRGHNNFFVVYKDALQELHGHMIGYRGMDYRKQYKVVLDLAAQWNQRWLAHRRLEMASWLHAATAYVDDTNTKLAAAADNSMERLLIERGSDFKPLQNRYDASNMAIW